VQPSVELFNRAAHYQLAHDGELGSSLFSASTLAICWGVIWPRGFTQSAAAVSGEILRPLLNLVLHEEPHIEIKT